MNTYHLQPLVGVGQITFGMPRAEVLHILGPSISFKKVPWSTHVTDAWHENGFQVFYCGTEPIVEYIELSRNSGFEAILLGNPVFSTVAQKLVTLIDEQSPHDRNNPELGSSFIFPLLEASLWRPDEEDTWFTTVGIGARGYYSE